MAIKDQFAIYRTLDQQMQEAIKQNDPELIRRYLANLAGHDPKAINDDEVIDFMIRHNL